MKIPINGRESSEGREQKCERKEESFQNTDPETVKTEKHD